MIRIRMMLPVLLALAALLVTPATASAACPAGKTAWILNGKSVCLKNRAPRAGTVADNAPAIVREWILRIAKPTKHQRFRLSRAFRRAIPKAARQASSLTVKARSRLSAPPSRSAKRRRKGLMSVAGASPVIDRVNVSSPEINAGNGVKVKSVIEGFEREDGTQSIDYRIEVKRGRDTIRLTPTMDFTSGGNEQQCPTAAGLVTGEDSSSTGGTMMQLRGRTVKKSITEIVDVKSTGRGWVGRDAKLGRVEADVTLTSRRYERGLSIEYVAKSGVEMGREGSASTAGAPAVRVKARAAGATAAQERAFERDYAAALSQSGSIANAMAASGEVIRHRIIDGEYVWYQIPNYCVSVQWEPWPEAVLNPGATRAVTAFAEANNGGGQAAGEFSVGSVGRGAFAAAKPSFDPGSPASFTATGAPQDENPQTVSASGILTSTAGRAAWDWTAARQDVDFPESFTGSVAVQASQPGQAVEFEGTATYTRTSIYVAPNGFATAWYEMSTAVLTSAKHSIGPAAGCRYEFTGSGGAIESGDLELRREPGGPTTYAFLYDMEIAGVDYPTVDCPPGTTGLSDMTFDADIYTAPNSQPFRPVGPGNVLVADGVSDVRGPLAMPSTASWSFTPAP